MDTRTKILSPERAIAVASELRKASIGFNVISGSFDILQAPMVRRLQELAAPHSRIFAVVLDPEHAVTAASARVELAASLRVINYVVHCRTGAEDLILRLQPAQWVREEVAHLASTERLIQHVLERHGRALARESSH